MPKVLYNTTYGGFRLTKNFCDAFQKRYGEELDAYMEFWDDMRADPRLVELFEEIGTEEKDISIKEVPDGCEWTIHEYDGKETVRWMLPKDIMLEDLRKGYLGQRERNGMNPLTQQWLDSGKTYKEFERDFYESFTHRDRA